MHTIHSEILASLNFNKNKMLSLDWRTTIHWNVVQEPFQNNHICQDCMKNTRSTFESMVILKSRGQICRVLWTRIWTLSPGMEDNLTFNSSSGIFSTILTYMIMVENCQNNIWVYGCSAIQGTKFYSCWNFIKSASQSGTYSYIPCSYCAVCSTVPWHSTAMHCTLQSCIARCTMYNIVPCHALTVHCAIQSSYMHLQCNGKYSFVTASKK